MRSFAIVNEREYREDGSEGREKGRREKARSKFDAYCAVVSKRVVRVVLGCVFLDSMYRGRARMFRRAREIVCKRTVLDARTADFGTATVRNHDVRDHHVGKLRHAASGEEDRDEGEDGGESVHTTRESQ